jgi:hypothetical protein
MRWLIPEEASDHLWKNHRLKRNKRRLAQLRAKGTGPQYHRDGNAVLYGDEDLDKYAEKHRAGPFTSTSEESARRQLTPVSEESAGHAPTPDADGSTW